MTTRSAVHSWSQAKSRVQIRSVKFLDQKLKTIRQAIGMDGRKLFSVGRIFLFLLVNRPSKENVCPQVSQLFSIISQNGSQPFLHLCHRQIFSQCIIFNLRRDHKTWWRPGNSSFTVYKIFWNICSQGVSECCNTTTVDSASYLIFTYLANSKIFGFGTGKVEARNCRSRYHC